MLLFIRKEQSQAIRREMLVLFFDELAPDLTARFHRAGWRVNGRHVHNASEVAQSIAIRGDIRSRRHLLMLYLLAAGFPREFSNDGALDFGGMLANMEVAETDRFALISQLGILHPVFNDSRGDVQTPTEPDDNDGGTK